MPAGDGALHPITRLVTDTSTVRWSVGGVELGTVVVLGVSPDRVGVVLGCTDRDGDSTAVGLTREEAADLRDGLAAVLDDPAVWS
jgi:hypothetical protein